MEDLEIYNIISQNDNSDKYNQETDYLQRELSANLLLSDYKKKLKTLKQAVLKGREQQNKQLQIINHLIELKDDHKNLKEKLEELKQADTYQTIEIKQQRQYSPKSSRQSQKTVQTIATNIMINSVEHFLQSGLSKYFTQSPLNIFGGNVQESSQYYGLTTSLKLLKKKVIKKTQEIFTYKDQIQQLMKQLQEKKNTIQQLEDILLEKQLIIQDKNYNQQLNNTNHDDLNQEKSIKPERQSIYDQRLLERTIQNNELQEQNKQLIEEQILMENHIREKVQELFEYENLLKQSNIMKEDFEIRLQQLEQQYKEQENKYEQSQCNESDLQNKIIQTTNYLCDIKIQNELYEQELKSQKQDLETQRESIQNITEGMNIIQIHDILKIEQNGTQISENCQIILRTNKFNDNVVQIECKGSSIILHPINIQYLKKTDKHSFTIAYTFNNQKFKEIYRVNDIAILRQICRRIKKSCKQFVDEQVNGSLEKDDVEDEQNNQQSILKSLASFFGQTSTK